MPWPAIIAGVAGVAEGIMGASSAHKANRTNIRLARENREWQEKMANTEMQRRVADLKQAGLNPVLAAGSGGASSPSVSSPTVEPTFRAEGQAGKTAMLAAQLQNIKANTAAQAADARSKNVEADIREDLRNMERDTRANRFVEAQSWDNLKTQILRNNVVSSGAQAEKDRRTIDSMVALAQQQARTGKLDLDALENIARVGGIEANKASGIIKLLIDFMRTQKK